MDSAATPSASSGAALLPMELRENPGQILIERFARLREEAPALAPAFQGASPFPHMVIDDFLPLTWARKIARDFPQASDSQIWTSLPSDDQRRKLGMRRESSLPDSLRQTLHELNAQPNIEWIQDITGVTGLIPDPAFVGGGLHQVLSGGRLNVHVDYSHHPQTRLSRRVNLILYLTEDWQDDWGGELELWNESATECLVKIPPRFNRCVVFLTTPRSCHGHPQPLACPEHQSRKSIALYFYSNGRPEEPGPVIEHNTTFFSKPGEAAPLATRLIRAASSSLFRELTPPLLYRFLRQRWNKTGS